MMTVKEIVEETVTYYSADPRRRAKIGSYCAYVLPNGRSCAVGRCMEGQAKLRYVGNISGLDAVSESAGNLDLLLDAKYRGHPLEFWESLQRLHDVDEHWDETGITRLGREYANNIVKLHGGDTQ